MLTAFELFSQYGIKSVSMDDIARNMGISKRTIYEFFDDKETLLVAGMDFNYKKIQTDLELLEKEPFTALDIILLLYEEFMRRPRWRSKKFYDDLKRYPAALKRKEEEKARFFKQCVKLLSRGVKEGVFQPDTNLEIVALLAKEQAKLIPPSSAFSNHSIAEVLGTVLYTFLRGISTEKGITILGRYAVKKTNLQQD